MIITITNRVTNLIDTFKDCPNLTDESLNNIMAMFLNSGVVASNKTLKNSGLTQAQATKCQSLSNWASLEANGWTTGY